jgi:hypothetical protein
VEELKKNEKNTEFMNEAAPIFNFKNILTSLENNRAIPLLNGNYYYFIEASSTRINGDLFQNAIHYRIGDSNSKRVTFELIDAVYGHILNSGRLPAKSTIRALFHHELCSRPCNYRIACAIAQRFIH